MVVNQLKESGTKIHLKEMLKMNCLNCAVTETRDWSYVRLAGKVFNAFNMAATPKSERCVEDVEKVMASARLNLKDLKNVSQALYYGENFVDNDMVLMEVDKHLLETVTKGGRSSLVFRGKDDDEVTCCTADETYLVREADTSNLLLVLPELRMNSNDIDNLDTNSDKLTVVTQKIERSFHTYLELTLVRPSLHRLRAKLEENLYEGKEVERHKMAVKYSFDDLLDIVQMSENELKNGLKQIEAYLIDGCWRLLEFDYQSRVVNHIINLILENSWDLNKIIKQDIINVLQELEPKCILEQSLDYFAVDLGMKSDDGQDLLQLREDKICRLYADMILRKAVKYNLKDFLKSWKGSVPEGFTVELKHLEGLVLVERECHPQVISRLTVWDLPESIEERFVSLFQIRRKWRCEDIKPFIMDLTNDKHTVDSLLTKYSRISIVNNERFCNAKYC
ncbi:hypothetical protein CHUAL_004722 [Chamberlinius hualienensis]